MQRYLSVELQMMATGMLLGNFVKALEKAYQQYKTLKETEAASKKQQEDVKMEEEK